MQQLAFAIVLGAMFALGWYVGHYLTILSEDTKKDLEEVRNRLFQMRQSYSEVVGRAAVYVVELHKLQRGLSRRTRQLENLKQKMQQAGVPIHSPGTRRVTALSANGLLPPGQSSGAAGSMGTVSRTTLSPVAPAKDPELRYPS